MLKRMLNRISENLATLNEHRPLKPSILKKLREQLTLEMTYHSNAIEGNRLTLKETHLVLHEGITIKGKNLKEHLEAKNHEEAMDFLFTIVDQKKTKISHQLIRQLHQLVVKDTESKCAGKYRETNVQILGSKHTPPPGYQIHQKMTEFLEWTKKNSKLLHPIEFAALAHHLFVSIHPFEDGNGRTGRLLMNLLLLQNGYPIAIILKNDRKKYYQSLQKADAGKTDEMIKITAQAVERTISIYLSVLEKSSPEKELISLSELSKRSEYSQKYLNLLVRKGLLSAKKEGRIWYSSLKLLHDYKKSRLRKR